MGFEDTKIKHLGDHVKKIAEWAHEHDPEFTLRIHAGENRKNMANVTESLRLAEQYKMRVRIGHAAHGLDKDAIEIAQRLVADGENKGEKARVSIEFNPDSNMALNNIDGADELNLVECITKGIPFVIGSDGGGLYQTDADQLWHAACFAASHTGIKIEDLRQWVMQSEEDHLQLEKNRFDRKLRASIEAGFLDRITHYKAPEAPVQTAAESSREDFERSLHEKHIALLPHDQINKVMGDKKPLMILGARGKEHWEDINPEEQRHIEDGIAAMLQQLDPSKVYLMIGRPKPTENGIANVLVNEVAEYNRLNPGKRFSLVSATVQAEQTEQSFTPGLTHVMPLDGGLFTVPDQLVDTVKKQDGHILFIGGGSFTRDAILVAGKQKVPFGLMNGAKGASTDKAKMMNPERSFEGADGMIAHLHQYRDEWFKLRFQEHPPQGSGYAR